MHLVSYKVYFQTCMLDSFIIYIQTFNLSVLVILSILVVIVEHSIVCFLGACGCAILAEAIQALTILPPRTFRVIKNSWV